MPANPDCPFIRIVEAQQQTHDRRFADAARTHKSDALAGLNDEIEPFMRGAAPTRIGEADTFKSDRWRNRADGLSIGLLVNDNLRVEKVKDRLGRRLSYHPVVH